MELMLTKATAPVWAASLHDGLLTDSILVFQRMAERAPLADDRAYAKLCLDALEAEKAKRANANVMEDA